jgi:hypothetical protein
MYWCLKINIVKHRSIDRQRLSKHIPAEAYARNIRASIARQRVSKQAFLKIDDDVFRRVREK